MNKETFDTIFVDILPINFFKGLREHYGKTEQPYYYDAENTVECTIETYIEKTKGVFVDRVHVLSDKDDCRDYELTNNTWIEYN